MDNKQVEDMQSQFDAFDLRAVRAGHIRLKKQLNDLEVEMAGYLLELGYES
ncbi:hypothetical protein O59_000395 [Cellvibrio sp. BR]|uniref:hypothetical protein n=1 Tax=Cellvibrio sp. BR TaxID=1134474 RepID=UPI000260082D|nr:hypothetical protein [Cellvibrio sp. BR]EIK46374.1 hypothetical protein O59_000395 [Cellvibrio sp. BR]